jgi:hypothetical protein
MLVASPSSHFLPSTRRKHSLQNSIHCQPFLSPHYKIMVTTNHKKKTRGGFRPNAGRKTNSQRLANSRTALTQQQARQQQQQQPAIHQFFGCTSRPSTTGQLKNMGNSLSADEDYSGGSNNLGGGGRVGGGNNRRGGGGHKNGHHGREDSSSDRNDNERSYGESKGCHDVNAQGGNKIGGTGTAGNQYMTNNPEGANNRPRDGHSNDEQDLSDRYRTARRGVNNSVGNKGGDNGNLHAGSKGGNQLHMMNHPIGGRNNPPSHGHHEIIGDALDSSDPYGSNGGTTHDDSHDWIMFDEVGGEGECTATGKFTGLLQTSIGGGKSSRGTDSIQNTRKGQTGKGGAHSWDRRWILHGWSYATALYPWG